MRIELTILTTQVGSPTFYFILSVIDTKWFDFHSVLSLNVQSLFLIEKQCIDIVISYPHTTSLYLHQHFKKNCEEIIEAHREN